MIHIQKKKNTVLNIMYLIISMLLVSFAWIGYHDAQMAQGAGLYLAIIQKAEERTLYDVLMDCIGALGIFIITIFPLIIFKLYNIASYLRLLCVLLAFVPMINPGTLVHFVEHISNWQFREDLSFFNVMSICEVIITPTAILFMLLCILHMFCSKEENEKKRTYRIVIVLLASILLVIYILFPNVSEYCRFLIVYLWVVIIFEKAEKFFGPTISNHWMMWLFYILCGLKGIYEIIMLLMTTHI